MTPRRHSLALRTVAAAAALVVAAAGSGVPMCVSLLAQAVAPCAMHSGHIGAAAHDHAAHVVAVAAQASGPACHQDAAGLGCAAGSACPTAGPAAPAWANVLVGVRAASHTGALGPAANIVSYLAPPLSPPPQA